MVGITLEKFAVLFDMDGLMLDTERMAKKAWTRALGESRYQLDDVVYLRMVGRTALDAQGVLAEVFGPDLPYQDLYSLRQAYYEEDIELNGVPIKQGLLELLDFLEEHAVPKAIASSTSSLFALRKLERAGIAHRFQTIVCGDQVSRGKPAPDLFLEAARQIGFPPDRCIVLEDSEAGIRAGHAAGAVPIMIPDLKQPEPEIYHLAYRVLPTLHEVIPLLDQFLKEGLPERSR